MANKTVEEKIDELAMSVAGGFREVYERMDLSFKQVHGRLAGIEQRLDRIDSKVTGLAGRVEVLEDVVQMVRTKLSL